MNTDDALLLAILKQPTDPLPKLAYADWLEEQGDPRHELLRLRHAVRQQRASNANVAAMTARARAILKQHGDPMLGAVLLGGGLQRCELVKRGWARRVFRLRGRVNALVEFNGRKFGHDTISADGRILHRELVWHPFPTLDFSLSGPEGSFNACIEISYFPTFVTVTALRFVLGNVPLYWEGCGPYATPMRTHLRGAGVPADAID